MIEGTPANEKVHFLEQSGHKHVIALRIVDGRKQPGLNPFTNQKLAEFAIIDATLVGSDTIIKRTTSKVTSTPLHLKYFLLRYAAQLMYYSWIPIAGTEALDSE